MTEMLLTCVVVACDGALAGHEELLLHVQDYVLPLDELGPEMALQRGGQKLLSRWLDAAQRNGTCLHEYTSDALYSAIQRYGWSFIDGAVAAQVRYSVWTGVAKLAIVDDQRELLDRLYSQIPSCRKGLLAFTVAAACGNLKLLRWLRLRGYDSYPQLHTSDAFVAAATSGAVRVVQWVVDVLMKPRPIIYWWRFAFALPSYLAMKAAVRNGHGPVVQWVFMRFPNDLGGERLIRLISYAFAHDQYEIATWLHHMYHPIDQGTTGSVHPVAPVQIPWCFDERRTPPEVYRNHLEFAYRTGRIDLLDLMEKALASLTGLNRLGFFGWKAARSGNIAAAQWALTRGLLSRSPRVLGAAAERGNLEFITWYQSALDEISSPAESAFYRDYGNIKARRYAAHYLHATASNGHFDCVKWLVDNWVQIDLTTGCFAVEYAVANNHLEIAQWLVDKRGVPCSVNAMGAAAANGHLRAVQWVYTQSGAIRRTAIRQAARNGHVRVVQWLHEMLDEGGDVHVVSPSVEMIQRSTVEMALEEAISGGHLRVVKYFLRCGLPPSQDAMHVMEETAKKARRGRIAKWIEWYRDSRVLQ